MWDFLLNRDFRRLKKLLSGSSSKMYFLFLLFQVSVWKTGDISTLLSQSFYRIFNWYPHNNPQKWFFNKFGFYPALIWTAHNWIVTGSIWGFLIYFTDIWNFREWRFTCQDKLKLFGNSLQLLRTGKNVLLMFKAKYVFIYPLWKDNVLFMHPDFSDSSQNRIIKKWVESLNATISVGTKRWAWF